MSNSRQRQNSRMKSMYKRRNRARTSINLVSLMDIFTILVFFLLVNSSDVEVFQSSNVQLPESVAEKKPKQTLTIVVSGKDIIVKGHPVVKVEDALASKEEIIPSLKKELDYHLRKELVSHDHSKPFTGKVTILGDKKIPYELLKKIMLTCSKTKYSRISLAVVQKEGQSG